MNLEKFLKERRFGTESSAHGRRFVVTVVAKSGGLSVTDGSVVMDGVGGVSLGREQGWGLEDDDRLIERLRRCKDESGQMWLGVWLPCDEIHLIDGDLQASLLADERDESDARLQEIETTCAELRALGVPGSALIPLHAWVAAKREGR